MFSSPTITIGIALLVAFSLVCFGIIRLMKHFQEEFRKDNQFKETPVSLGFGGKRTAYKDLNSTPRRRRGLANRHIKSFQSFYGNNNRYTMFVIFSM